MDAIVTAGGIPQPQDPLYSFSKGDSKALIDVAGKPMVQWVLDALNESSQVDNIIIIGLSSKTGLVSKKPIYFISNQGRMLANIVAGVAKAREINKKSEYMLIVSSDIPTLKGSMVDWVVKTCMTTKHDMYYGICPRDVMEMRFPGSNRTYTHLKDGDVCGSDINVIHYSMTTDHLDLWENLIGNRKSPLRQATVVGFSLAWKVLTRSATAEELAEMFEERTGVRGRVYTWANAEPCMDIDKPHQLELLRADLAKKPRSVNAKSAGLKSKKAVAKKPAAKKTLTKKSTVKRTAAKPAPKKTPVRKKK